jgi:L-gulono-1,4-lactone dehydrogenase
MARREAKVWRNWAGNQEARPAAIDHPATEADLVAVVRAAAAAGKSVKVVGSGHSFTDLALTTGRLVLLDRYTRLLAVDTDRFRVRVQAGMPLSQLNLALERRGLAMPNLGDIAYQTVAGATSTSTHGTGAGLRGLAAQIVGLRLVTADGEVLDCDAEHEAEVFHCARVGLGALGIVSEVTLQVVPAFRLRVVEQPERVDDLVADLDRHVDGNDHFEFFWVPHTGWALTKRNNRTDEPLERRPKARAWVDDYLLENVAFGAVCRLGRLRPSLIPRLARALPSTSRTSYVDDSFRVFASPRLVHFYEMEYAIPRAACGEALQRLRAFVKESGLQLSFPVEVRFTAADDIPLSTAYGRESAYLAVHVYQGMPYHQYFEGVEKIMDDYEGRPHWGKLHFQSAATLAPRYPEWERFQAVRRRLDPEGRFANDATRRLLGP